MASKSVVLIAGLLFLAGIGGALLLLRIDGQPMAGTMSDGAGAQVAAGTAGGEHDVPRRVVCLAPIGTEAVFALGAEGRLVGVGEFCDYPAAAKSIASAGGEFNPNFERLTVMRPDLVIGLGRCENLERFCEQGHVRMLHISMANLQSLYDDLRAMGRELGVSANAERLCGEIEGQIAKVRGATAGKGRPRVLFVLYRRAGSLTGLTTTAAGTTHDDLIGIAGGENIFSDLKQLYPQVSKEAIIARQPEIIIETRSDVGENAREQAMSDWRQLPSVPAVRDGKIYFLSEDLMLKTGPRVGQIADELARLIHPESFVSKETHDQ